MAVNQSLEILGPIPLFLKTGKPRHVADELIRATGEKQKLQIMVDVMTACAVGVESEVLDPGLAAKRIGAMFGLDDSEDHNLVCQALEETDRTNPKAVETIIAKLPANKLIALDLTTGPSSELIIDYATPAQLATVVRYLSGKLWTAQKQQTEDITEDIYEEETPYSNPRSEDKNMRNHAKRKNATRGLGRLLDRVVARDDEDNDGFLESFGAAILGDSIDVPKGKNTEYVSPSYMLNVIADIALERSSAARVIQSLPDADPRVIEIRKRLRENER